MLRKMVRKDTQGFTLIELMIVIAIIGILAAIAIPQFSAYRKRGFNAAAESDLRNAITAQEAYYADYQRYNDTASNLSTYGLQTSTGVTIAVVAASTDNTQYTMTATHSSGDKTYSIQGPGGTIGTR